MIFQTIFKEIILLTGYSVLIRFIKNRRDLELHKTLAFMYGIAETHENISHPHAIKILNNFQGYTKGTLQKLVKKDYSHLKDNLTKEQFQEIKLLFIDRKAKKEYYKDLYIDSFK